MSAEGLAIPLCSPPGRATLVVLRGGETMPFRADDWSDAMVMVQRGSLEVRCRSGRTAVFERGSIVCFRHLPLATLSAQGDQDVVLLALRR